MIDVQGVTSNNKRNELAQKCLFRGFQHSKKYFSSGFNITKLYYWSSTIFLVWGTVCWERKSSFQVHSLRLTSIFLCFAQGKAATFEMTQTHTGSSCKAGGWSRSSSSWFTVCKWRRNSKNALYFKSRDADENNEEGGGFRASWAVLCVAPCPERADGGSDLPAEQRGHSTLGFVVCRFFVISWIYFKTKTTVYEFSQEAVSH